MRLAWFAPAPPTIGHQDTAALLDELQSVHDVRRYHHATAHDFVWQHARQPFDLCVFELSDTADAAFVWPYLLHYPGLLRLRDISLHRSRARLMQHHHRSVDYAAEVAFGGATRIALLASRLAVLGDAWTAQRVQDAHPSARVRHAPLCVRGDTGDRASAAATPRVAVVGTTRTDAVRRAAARAHDAGSRFDLRMDVEPDRLHDADAVVVMPWPPPAEPPAAALAAMAAARPAVVYETGVTAGWPALDPQTWQPRDLLGGSEPAVISIDPRDEEHSLMLALRRLADDGAFRQRVGRGAFAWWQSNAAPPAVAAVWNRLLEEAASLPPPARPDGWPSHLAADGTERARALLGETGVTVDFLAGDRRES